jgi:hypothetical protein
MAIVSLTDFDKDLKQLMNAQEHALSIESLKK